MTLRMYVHGLEDLSLNKFREEILRQCIFRNVLFLQERCRNWKFEFVAKTQSIPFQKYFSKTDLTSFQIYSIFSGIVKGILL